ncbi:hypothetical protein QR685DRAFT_431525, partial [Neurospora intermedia]
ANKILFFTLKNPNINIILNINNSNKTNRDLKVIYNLIQSYITYITKEAYSNIFAEYLTIKYTNFNTIDSFFNRYTLLRKRIKNIKFKIIKDFEVTFLYNTIKIVYFIDAKY